MVPTPSPPKRNIGRASFVEETSRKEEYEENNNLEGYLSPDEHTNFSIDIETAALLESEEE